MNENKETRRLKDAIIKYGEHRTRCPKNPYSYRGSYNDPDYNDCTCGYHELVTELLNERK